MDIFNIQALIREGRLITANDVDPTEAYLQMGVFQKGNRPSNSSNADTYRSYAIPLSELSGSSLPIVRYVYLVADASDALRMGGTASNVYTTFQTAYDAANALQVALGGNNIVELRVGNTIANQPTFGNITTLVGDLNLVADYNFRVRIVGDNPTVSVLGSIIGSGLNISNTSTPAVFANVSFQSINTRQNNASGNSGVVSLRLSNTRIFSIDTSITNVANTTGNGGAVSINTRGSQLGFSCTIGTILTSSQGATSTAGNLNLNGSFLDIGGVQLANNNLGGQLTITSIGAGIFIGNLVSFSLSLPIGTGTTITNVNFQSIDLLWYGQVGSLGNPGIKFINCNCSGQVRIRQNGTTADPLSVLWTGGSMQNWVGNTLTRLLAYDTSFWVSQSSGIVNVISTLGNNSTLANCSVVKEGPATGACILGIGTGCTIKNTTIRGGGISISNTSAVTVISDNSIFDKLMAAAVTIELDGGFPYLIDGGAGSFDYSGSLYKCAWVYLGGSGGGSNTVSIYNLAIGEKYILNVLNTTGTDTVTIIDGLFAMSVGVAQVGSTGGTYTPTAIAGAIDQLLITFDGSFIWVTPVGQNFQL